MNTFSWKDLEQVDAGNINLIESQDDNTQEEDFDWKQLKTGKEEEGFVEKIRPVARTGSRLLETIAGLPGDIREFSKFIGKAGESAGEYAGEKIRTLTGKEPVPEEEKEKFRKEISSSNKLLKRAFEFLPTSEDLKNFSSYITSGFTDPQDAQEEFSDEIVSLGTSLLIGSKDPTKFKSLMKALLVASSAKGAGKGVEFLGGGEKAQVGAELGTMLLTSLLTNRFADKFVSEKYKKARSLIPTNQMIGTGKMNRNLDRLERTLKKGLPKTSQSKSEVISSLEELKNKASGGALPVDDLVESFHDVSEKLTQRKLFSELSKPERKKLKFLYSNLQDTIREEIKDYGKFNKEFYKEWSEANKAFSALAQSRNTKDFIMSNLRTIPGHLATSAAIKLFLGAPALGSAAAGFTVYQTGKILNRIAQNPSLRKYYLQVAENAAKENLPAFIKSLEKLDKEIKKDQKK